MIDPGRTCLLLGILMSGTAFTAYAQTQSDSQAPDEAQASDTPAATSEADRRLNAITVTARKREESITDVPVAVNAFDQSQIEDNAITTIEDVSAFTPGLVSGTVTGETGGNLFLRGIGSGQLSALLEQSVSINIDGVQTGGQMMYAGMLDLGQIEVLRGPQALFFGKNSPGGVISIKTAKPTNEFEASVKLGHEIEANETYGEFVVSGPITNDLGGRFMGHYSKMDGWLDIKSAKVDAGPLSAYGFTNETGPMREEYALRGTLEYDPAGRFDVTASYTFSSLESDDGYALNAQIIACPTGARQAFLPQYAAIEDCKPNDTIVTGNITQDILDNAPLLRNRPSGFTDDELALGVVTVNYDLTDALQLTSVTGYYYADINMGTNYALQPAPLLASATGLETTQYSEELRLTSDFDGRFNFVLGGYYEVADSLAYINPNAPLAGLAATETTDQDKTAKSLFGQALIDITDQLEVSAGLRYSDEEKDGVYRSTLVPGVVGKPKYSSDNTSPEIVLTYKPTQDLTIYGGYKEGFKSGGIDAAFQAPTNFLASGGTAPASYEAETASGFEGGIKAVLLDGTLNVNLAAFDYTYENIQLSFLDTSTLSVRVVNAAEASTRGLEADFQWAVRGIDGLTVRGAGAYLDAQYEDYLSDCYNGQSIANGCNLDPNPATGAFRKQDLSGVRMARAPEFSGTLGFTYEWPVFGNYTASFSPNLEYSSEYQTNLENSPYGVQDAYTRLNATLRVFSDVDGWNFAVKGRNLTEEYIITRASTDTLYPTVSGTAAEVPVDYFGSVGRGREVYFEVKKTF